MDAVDTAHDLTARLDDELEAHGQLIWDAAMALERRGWSHDEALECAAFELGAFEPSPRLARALDDVERMRAA